MLKHLRGCVDSGHLGATVRERAADGAHPARQVEHPLARQVIG
nr:hypothetical protein [Flexivirga caeni]